MNSLVVQIAQRGLLAIIVVALAACATPMAEQPASKPAEPASVAAVPAPVSTVVQSEWVGDYQGKWTVDGLGHSGKATLTITAVNGNQIMGEATWFDTPFGDLTEPVWQSEIKTDGTLTVRHKNNAEYMLKLVDRKLRGNFKYEVYTGTLDMDRK
ncbi:hypothetical protein [Chitinivorax sp. B]|uniref:hypothetical protein n=1 Tax=Chitinivorax sp. B TaxID=2502235 RepID=UPI0010F64423|nr:hypothetical protein [Chitinivorax sp. B]